MNRDNRALLKKYHIEIAGKPLGRPSKEMQSEEYKMQATKDMEKRNEIESTFGAGKEFIKQMMFVLSLQIQLMHGQQHAS